MKKNFFKLFKEQKSIFEFCFAYSVAWVIGFITLYFIKKPEHVSFLETLFLCFILVIVSFITGIVLAIKFNKSNEKEKLAIIKKFSLKANSYTKLSYTLKDNFKNRKMLNEIINLIKDKSTCNEFDLLSSKINPFIIQTSILNPVCTMTNLLMHIISLLGGNFYLFLDEKNTIFLCVKYLDEEIFKKEIDDLLSLTEDIKIEDYV